MKKLHPICLPLLGLALLSACATARAPQGVAAFPKILVAPFKIVPEQIADAPARTDQDVFAQMLAAAAAASAGRSLVQEHFAEIAELAPSGSQAVGQALLTGTVTMPVSLPPGLRGLRADSRSGPLAKVTLQLLGPDGKTIRSAEAEISWREARWLTGAPKLRRNRPVQEVLVDSVKKVAERAVRRL